MHAYILFPTIQEINIHIYTQIILYHSNSFSYLRFSQNNNFYRQIPILLVLALLLFTLMLIIHLALHQSSCNLYVNHTTSVEPRKRTKEKLNFKNESSNLSDYPEFVGFGRQTNMMFKATCFKT